MKAKNGRNCAERAAEGQHDPHAQRDAEEQEEDRAQAGRHRRARVDVGHSGMKPQRGDEDVQHRQSAQQEQQVLQPQRPGQPKAHAQQHRQNDHLLGVVKNAAELAVDDFLRRKIGHQQQVERPDVALARQAT